MKLVVDIGNSFTKLAVFKGEEIIDFQTIKKPEIKVLSKLLSDFPQISSSIISSVGAHDPQLTNILEEKGTTIELTNNTPVPFINRYGTPQTLGKDRIAIASAATMLHPNQNTLIIDIGTCVTYDIILSSREYLGGGISPGLEMRFKSLHNFTHRLPLINLPDANSNISMVGNSTKTSILSGVIVGLRAEVEHTINQYKKTYSPLITIISGGDYKYFEKLVKSNIFATPNIVVWGLKNILDFNEKN